MTETEKTNLIHFFCTGLQKIVSAHRRANVIQPTGEEYFACLQAAVTKVEPLLHEPVPVGRPRKQKPPDAT